MDPPKIGPIDQSNRLNFIFPKSDRGPWRNIASPSPRFRRGLGAAAPGSTAGTPGTGAAVLRPSCGQRAMHPVSNMATTGGPGRACRGVPRCAPAGPAPPGQVRPSTLCELQCAVCRLRAAPTEKYTETSLLWEPFFLISNRALTRARSVANP